ncbi:MAG: prephenate dehydrogenase/arogenate dehydrogenase family protein [Dehalococcoidia bacterium]|nr:prephenate dehydrogenase/arogenate dehydrogenase family protein [Dehalococcoidia bacterium]
MKERISIIGLGLIGGSIGLALKRNSPDNLEIVGYARHPETRFMARQRGAIDMEANSVEEAVSNANMVIIATPVTAIEDVMKRIAARLPSGCVVTDTASTKECGMQWAEEYLPPTVNFIGGHPMAGKESAGIEAAEFNLFHKCTYCLVENATSTPEALRAMNELVARVGAKSLFINASEHDRLVAGISHLPNLISIALVATTTKSPQWSRMSRMAAGGYRDTTRLASSDVKMLSDIFLTNQNNVSYWLDAFIGELNKLRQMTNNEHAAELRDAMSQAKAARQKWMEESNKQSL